MAAKRAPQHKASVVVTILHKKKMNMKTGQEGPEAMKGLCDDVSKFHALFAMTLKSSVDTERSEATQKCW